MSGSATILETEELTKDFSGLVAVDGISWELGEGETKGILGPNGAGKTTFFNLITGVLSPSSGSVYFKGEDVTGEPAHEISRRGIAKTFQTTNLFDDLTVFENVRIAAQVNETTFDMTSRVDDLTSVQERAAEVIDQVNLQDIEGALVDELSHGDQRKVEVAVALATDPDVILFDEPTSGVSSDEIGDLGDLFEDLIASGEYTFVVIEHNVEFLLDLADVVTVFHEGRILVEDDPRAITENEDVQRVYLE